MVQLDPVIELNTFSIAAREGETGAFGVAVATKARVNTELGRQGLLLVDQGVPIDVGLSALLWKDGEREIRQVHGVDAERAFCHTGTGCVAWCGHEAGADFTVAGNMLTGSEVIAAMARAFRDGEGELSGRLLLALEAGQAAGGDKRGKQSAALLVASPEPRMHHNLRVDDNADPVAELRRVYEVVVEHSGRIEREYGPEAARLTRWLTKRKPGGNRRVCRAVWTPCWKPDRSCCTVGGVSTLRCSRNLAASRPAVVGIS